MGIFIKNLKMLKNFLKFKLNNNSSKVVKTEYSSLRFKYLIANKLNLNLLFASILLNIKMASALVDDRLAGEGTGKILGINDPILGWVIIGVFTIVWSAYYTATKDLGCESEEDGLSL